MKKLFVAAALAGAMLASSAFAGDAARDWSSSTSVKTDTWFNQGLSEYMLRKDLLGNRTTQNYYGDFNSTTNCSVDGACQTTSTSTTNINGSTITTISGQGNTVNANASANNTSQNGTASSLRNPTVTGTITIGSTNTATSTGNMSNSSTQSSENKDGTIYVGLPKITSGWQ